MKNKVSIILVFIITLLVSVGGLFVMQQRLDTHSTGVLNEKLNSKETIFRANSEEELKKKYLTEKELVEVVYSMKYEQNRRTHEPVKGQLSMNQAINKGEAWAEKIFSIQIKNYKKLVQIYSRMIRQESIKYLKYYTVFGRSGWKRMI